MVLPKSLACGVLIVAALAAIISTVECAEKVQCGGGGNLTKGSCNIVDIVSVSVKQSAKPCENFYEYACGNWIEATELKDSEAVYNHFNEMKKRVGSQLKDLLEDKSESPVQAINVVKRFYKGCIDVETRNKGRTAFLQSKLKAIGYWPIIHGVKSGDKKGLWSEKNYNLTELLSFVNRESAVFFATHVIVDVKNPNRNVLTVDQTEQNRETSNKEHMESVIKLLSEDAGVTPNDADLKAGIKRILDLEAAVNKIKSPLSDYYANATAIYNPRKLSKMSDVFHDIDWKAYLRRTFPSDLYEYIESDPTLIVKNPAYMKRLCDLLHKTDKRTIVDYVIWKYVAYNWFLILDERYDAAYQQFLRVENGEKSPEPLSDACITKISELLPKAIDAMYVRNYFSNNAKASVIKMIKKMRSVYKRLISASDWMSDGTKKEAVKKLSKMILLIGAPKMLYDDGQLNAYYKHLTIPANANYTAVYDAVSAFKHDTELRKLLAPVQKNEFQMDAVSADALYHAFYNSITMTASLLQPPMFDISVPSVFGYASTGFIAARMLADAFNVQGSQYDSTGQLKNWWDAESRDKYDKRSQCFIDQVADLKVPSPNNKEGYQKLDEQIARLYNIAHISGLTVAYKAFKEAQKKEGKAKKTNSPGLEKFSADQLFFLGYAQTWCAKTTPEKRALDAKISEPYDFMVNIAIQNQPNFATAFRCPAGAPMNPKKKCAIW